MAENNCGITRVVLADTLPKLQGECKMGLKGPMDLTQFLAPLTKYLIIMKILKVAFDVDDCILIPSVAARGLDVPNYETIAMFSWFKKQGCDMIIWSGSGIDWATRWAEKLGLEARIIAKGSEEVDLAFDDCDVDLGKVNVKVKRVNNQISRAEWNKKDKN